MRELIERVENVSHLEEEDRLDGLKLGKKAVEIGRVSVQALAWKLMYLIREIDDLPMRLSRHYKGNKDYAKVEGELKNLLDEVATDVESARKKLGDATVAFGKAVKVVKGV